MKVGNTYPSDLPALFRVLSTTYYYLMFQIILDRRESRDVIEIYANLVAKTTYTVGVELDPISSRSQDYTKPGVPWTKLLCGGITKIHMYFMENIFMSFQLCNFFYSAVHM